VRTPAPIERLVAALRRLPGIGEKSASRLAFFLLSAPDGLVAELADAISRVKREIVLCAECFDLTDVSPCGVCRDAKRDAGLLCVVEEPADRAAIERSGGFGGRYHVLGGALSPLDGIGPDALRIAELEARVRSGGVREVILATNPNAEGDAAHLIAERPAPWACHGSPTDAARRRPRYTDHVTVGLRREPPVDGLKRRVRGRSSRQPAATPGARRVRAKSPFPSVCRGNADARQQLVL
jgi:recombination protein RecR